MNHDEENRLTEQEKIDQLNQQAWEVRVSDSLQALEFSKKALELAEKAGYTKGKAQGLRTLGFSYIRLSKHQEALGYSNESLQLFRSLNDLKGESDVCAHLGIIYRSLGDYGTSLTNLYKSLQLRQQTDYKEGESLSLYHLGVTYKYLGNFEKALELLLQSLTLGRSINNWIAESYALNLLGQIYFEIEDHQQALVYYQQSLAIRQQTGDRWGEAGCLDNIGFAYTKLGHYQQALDYFNRSLAISEAIGDQKGQGNALLHLAFIEKQSGNRKKGLIYGNKSLEIRRSIGDKKGQAELLLFLAELTVELQEPEMETECFRLLEKAFLLAEETKALDLLAKVRFSFYQLNKRHNRFEEALLHLEKYNSLEKELHRDALNQKIINIEISHNAEQARKEAEIFQLRNVELAALYEESKAQKVVIENQKKLVEESLIQLKETQNQLIQKEKMASLGELTAGIAHEIQNPLNFVINFSELSIELAEEIKQALMNGREGKAIELENDLKQNLAKINYHGKRADSIVKNMLQHSRKNSGQFELTDIHILIEEYLRLAFQGMRTKERNFNVSVQTYFDNHLEKINIMPQEIGRVLVNLLNNAFYSVIKKRQQLSDQYVPEIILTTRRLSKALEISVKDNGLGIPHQALEKIFQPFFTTKPAGEGVGLGLSLSYDIITKGHGGEFFVETKEGGYAEFVIRLPLKASV